MIAASWWEKQYWQDIDVVVVGSGICGLQVATNLKRKFPEQRVVVIDRDPLGLGASSRNAGFACFGSVTELLDDAAQHGMDQALALAERRYSGIKLLLDQTGASAIGYAPTGSLEVFKPHSAAMAPALEQLDSLNQMLRDITGLDQTFKPESTVNSGMNIADQGIRNIAEGLIDSSRLLLVLRKLASDAGVEIYGGMEVSNATQTNNGMQLNCGRFDISTRQVVWCTNAFSGQFVPFADFKPARGQVLVTSPIQGLTLNGAYFFDAGYTYFRHLTGGRVLIGGFRNLDFHAEETFDLETGGKVEAGLLEFLRETVLPGIDFDIDCRWAGTMSMGSLRAPKVERLSQQQVVCAGMGGMGVALSARVAEEVAALFT